MVDIPSSRASSSRTSKQGRKKQVEQPQQQQDFKNLGGNAHYTRDELIYLTEAACACKRYAEMADFATKFARLEKDKELNYSERELLSMAFRHMIRSRRNCYRVLVSQERKEDEACNRVNLKRVNTYKKEIEQELTDLCVGAVALFDSLLPNATSDEAKVFYHKTSGDFMRYVTEYSKSSMKT